MKDYSCYANDSDEALDSLGASQGMSDEELYRYVRKVWRLLDEAPDGTVLHICEIVREDRVPLFIGIVCGYIRTLHECRHVYQWEFNETYTKLKKRVFRW